MIDGIKAAEVDVVDLLAVPVIRLRNIIEKQCLDPRSVDGISSTTKVANHL